MIFVCYPRCTTCQNAQKYLDAHGVGYSVRNIKENNPSRDELAAWHTQSGLELKRFFNTSGLQYRALDLKNRLPAMNEAEMLDLLATDGMLVKRPLLIGEDFVLVGFKKALWDETLKIDE